jgi:hypothetical protein
MCRRTTDKAIWSFVSTTFESIIVDIKRIAHSLRGEWMIIESRLIANDLIGQPNGIGQRFACQIAIHIAAIQEKQVTRITGGITK